MSFASSPSADYENEDSISITQVAASQGRCHHMDVVRLSIMVHVFLCLSPTSYIFSSSEKMFLLMCFIIQHHLDLMGIRQRCRSSTDYGCIRIEDRRKPVKKKTRMLLVWCCYVASLVVGLA